MLMLLHVLIKVIQYVPFALFEVLAIAWMCDCVALLVPEVLLCNTSHVLVMLDDDVSWGDEVEIHSLDFRAAMS
jgi:hypothetical protein